MKSNLLTKFFGLLLFCVLSVVAFCQESLQGAEALSSGLLQTGEGKDVMLKSAQASVNLVPYKPGGWDDKLVISTVAGTNTSDPLILTTETVYIDWAALNTGPDNVVGTITFRLYIDGMSRGAWTYANLASNTYTFSHDFNAGKFSAGSHTLRFVVDSEKSIAETNENDNEYIRTFMVYDKNVTPYQPSGWDNKIVLSHNTGDHTSESSFFNNLDLYVDWAIQNIGASTITETFHTKLYVDGVLKNTWTTIGLAAGSWANVSDYNIGKLAIGSHTIQVVTDSNGEVVETNEGDNSYSRTISVGPSYNLLPYQPGGWDNKLVISAAPGTNTSTALIFDTDNIYVDWSVLNNGYNDFTTTFYVRLFIDGVSRGAWTKGGLVHNTYTWAVDFNVGKLAAGAHTFRLVADADGHVAESDETDNEYIRTITVVNKNLTPHQPAGWDDKIVISSVTGTNTSAAEFCESNPLYIDWAVINNGSYAISESFSTRLLVDGITKAT